ncbi:hypothetical protein NDU88_006517 [Pleurodeles waltl]|uniref:Uncharacterized protein n=1 Tax=Pleurodeles waltl TaxID=8319 RepID=A0AAV7QHU9_PLEWA|nr:hypothetical protein NDU88_006517 [Pleurodeles waltl]
MRETLMNPGVRGDVTGRRRLQKEAQDGGAEKRDGKRWKRSDGRERRRVTVSRKRQGEGQRKEDGRRASPSPWSRRSQEPSGRARKEKEVAEGGPETRHIPGGTWLCQLHRLPFYMFSTCTLSTKEAQRLTEDSLRTGVSWMLLLMIRLSFY